MRRKDAQIRRHPHDFAQATFDPIALDGTADLLCHSEADARTGSTLGFRGIRQEREKRAMSFSTSTGPKEISTFPQPQRGCRRSTDHSRCRRPVRAVPTRSGYFRRGNQAERRLRPRDRRAAITFRPPTVAILARKPWRRLRTILLGWKVRFTLLLRLGGPLMAPLA